MNCPHCGIKLDRVRYEILRGDVLFDIVSGKLVLASAYADEVDNVSCPTCEGYIGGLLKENGIEILFYSGFQIISSIAAQKLRDCETEP